MKKLICSNCKKFLNVAPFAAEGSDRVVCGRCVDDTEKDWFSRNLPKNKTAENVLKKVKFPCSFVKNGCTYLLNWDEVAVHERSCLHHDYACVKYTMGSCTWTGSSSKLEQHFNECHNELFLRSNTFTLDLSQDNDVNLLLKYEKDIFLSMIKVNVSKTSKLWIGMRVVDCNSKKYEFGLKVANITFDPIALLGENEHLLEDNSIVIPVDGIKMLLGGKQQVDCTFLISEINNFGSNMEEKTVLEEFTCCPVMNCSHIGNNNDIENHFINCTKNQCKPTTSKIKKYQIDEHNCTVTSKDKDNGWNIATNRKTITCKHCKESIISEDFDHQQICESIYSKKISKKRKINCKWCYNSIYCNAIWEHNAVCTKRIVECKYCNAKFIHFDYIKHQASCPTRKVKCKFCLTFVTISYMDIHKLRCIKRTTPCRWCFQKILHVELENHEDSCKINVISEIIMRPRAESL